MTQQDQTEGQFEAEAQQDAAEAAEALAVEGEDLVESQHSADYKALVAYEHPFLERCAFVAGNQYSVNNAMAGEDWQERAAEHGHIDYRMATLDELQEFWNCAWNFKWWDKKNGHIDYRNARMELVDILHFIVSEDLAAPGQPEAELIGDVASRMAKGIRLALAEREITLTSILEAEDQEASRIRTLKSRMMDFISDIAKGSVNWPAFWSMVLLFDPNDGSTAEGRIEKVLNLYSAKAVLNKFRTMYRKSAAGYRKVWVDGREDNDIMMAWLDQQPAYPGDAVLNLFLEETYQRVLRG